MQKYKIRSDYGIKRDYPIIELFLRGDYVGVTTWARTCREAREVMANDYNCSTNDIQARYKK